MAENRLYVRDRGILENGAEIKTIHAPRTIDVSSDLIDEIVAYVGKAERNRPMTWFAHTVSNGCNKILAEVRFQKKNL